MVTHLVSSPKKTIFLLKCLRTAYCLLASGKFLGDQAKSNDLKASVKYGSTSSDWATELPIMRESLNTQAKDKAVTISNKESGTLYVTMTTKGTPFPGTESSATKGIDVDIRYRDLNGSTLDVSSLKQGQNFEATVSVSNRKPTGLVKDVALSHIFPSGWEIEMNDSLMTHFQLQILIIRTFVTIECTPTLI